MKFYTLCNMNGEMVGIARWNAEEVEMVRAIYKRQGIIIVEKTK